MIFYSFTLGLDSLFFVPVRLEKAPSDDIFWHLYIANIIDALVEWLTRIPATLLKIATSKRWGKDILSEGVSSNLTGVGTILFWS